MLATASTLPDGSGWAYEPKWDGLRAIVAVDRDGQVQLRSRGGHLVTDRFPELAHAPPGLRDVLLDGEVIVVDPNSGRPGFERAARRLQQTGAAAQAAARRDPAVLVAFDALWIAGRPLLDLAYHSRRAALEDLPLTAPAWQRTPVFHDAGAAWNATGQQQLEGVVAKRLASRYQPGRRTTSWRKQKHWTTTQALIVGWRPLTRPAAVLVAVGDAYGGLRLAGLVEWGLTSAWRAGLAGVLAALRTDVCPLAVAVSPPRGTQWVQPQLAIDIRHLGWTPTSRLRQPIATAVRIAARKPSS